MAKRSALFFILGTLVGAVATYAASAKREELMGKLDELQEQLRNSEISDKAKQLVKDITDNIQTLLSTKSEELSEEEKKDILEEVEEKIQKLEETIKSEGE